MTAPAWLQADLAANAPAFSFTAAIAVAGEQARLRPHLSLAFPATEVVAAECLAGIWHVTLGLPGLYGAHSPLPTSYTEDLLADEPAIDSDPLRRGLYDVLHQQVYRLLADVLDHHREPQQDARLIAQFSGLIDRRIGERIPGEALLAWAGLLSGRSRGADALERVLSGWAGVPCVVEECIALWTPLPDDHCTRLGAANSTLAIDCVAGGWFVSRATAFRVEIGPVPWTVMESWLPDGHHLGDTLAVIDLLNGDALDVEVVLVIDTATMPCPPLGAARLGRDLRTTGPAAAVRREVVYRSTGIR